MNNFTTFFDNFNRTQRISFLILIFLTILTFAIGFQKLAFNDLNYNWSLYLTGFLACFRIFSYNLVKVEEHLNIKNWFQIALDVILFFFGLMVTVDAIKMIPSSNFPLSIVINFLVANLLFFISVYLNKTSKIYFAQLINLLVIIASGGILYYIQINQVPNNIFVVLQALASHIIVFSEIIMFFTVCKYCYKDSLVANQVEVRIENKNESKTEENFEIQTKSQN